MLYFQQLWTFGFWKTTILPEKPFVYFNECWKKGSLEPGTAFFFSPKPVAFRCDQACEYTPSYLKEALVVGATTRREIRLGGLRIGRSQAARARKRPRGLRGPDWNRSANDGRIWSLIGPYMPWCSEDFDEPVLGFRIDPVENMGRDPFPGFPKSPKSLSHRRGLGLHCALGFARNDTRANFSSTGSCHWDGVVVVLGGTPRAFGATLSGWACEALKGQPLCGKPNKLKTTV